MAPINTIKRFDVMNISRIVTLNLKVTDQKKHIKIIFVIVIKKEDSDKERVLWKETISLIRNK